MGGIGPQRRLRRRQPHPRPGERKVALAQGNRQARGDGPRQPRRHAGRYSRGLGSTSTGSAPACCRWRPNRIRCPGCRRRQTTERGGSSASARCVTRWRRRRYLAGLFSPDTSAIVHPAKLAFELARACEADRRSHLRANRTSHRSNTSGTATSASRRVRERSRPTRAVLATNVFPSLVMTQPASDGAGV